MSIKFYRLYCEFCNYNRITDGTDVEDLYLSKRSKIDTAVPKIDAVTGKVVKKEPIAQTKQFRCPKCGRLITPKKIPEPNSNKQNEESFNSGS